MSSKSKKIVNEDSLLHESELSYSLPWPEWSDFDLNAEPWDYPRSGEFTDPQQIVMPRSLQPTEWKRFRELPFVHSPIIHETISNYPDFITNNRHLLHSDFIRCFVSTLINIQYYGRNGLEVDNRTSNFSWNMGNQCWKGWFNVYSLNKAGKGTSHRPMVNPKGRYVVRIFYMGCWRKILVDDSIPVDKRGRPLLPRTINSNELWPLILAKAMLKIAALSWTNQREIVDCSLIACLTGWIDLSLNVSHISPRDQWEFLIKYAKHFEWPQDEKEETDQSKSDEMEELEKSRKSKTKVTKLEVLKEPQPTILFLSLEDMKDAAAKEIPGMTPCWNHQIYVELSRDVPLDPAQVKPPLAKWKIHRWLDWAIHHGLADASEYFVPTRHLLIVSPLRQCSADSSYAYDELEEFGEEDSSETTLGSRVKKNLLKSHNTTNGLLKGKSEDIEMPDLSLWGDFNKLSYYLREVHLFYRQKFFKYSIKVSNSAKSFATNDGMKGKNDSSTKDVKKTAIKSSGPSQALEKIYEYQDKVWQSRNEPLYLFVDSVDEKFFLINFSTIRDSLDDPSGKNSSLIIERHNFFKRITENKTVARLKTRGTKSMVFQLEPGRHLLRIFVNYESSYHAIILSDTPFQIGDRSKMHELMTTEAHRLNETARKISNSVKKAFESFGTESYMTDLKNFHQSYMPDSSRTLDKKYKKVLKSIHNWFIEDFFGPVQKQFSPVDFPAIRRAVRIFFLDPSIGVKMQITDLSSNHEDEDVWENEEDDWKPNKNAMIIQSFFRMAMIKNYKKIHNTSHKEHNSIKKSLWRVIELFNYERRESVANSLLRAIVKHDERLKIIYPWAKDIEHVIQIQELVGRVTCFTIDQWFPIVRIFVNTEKFKTVFASVDLFANFSNYKVRVFENDANREMFRVANNVTPNHYRYRKNGYTIFAYGWSDFQKYIELDWSLHLTTVKCEPNFRWIGETEAIPVKSEIPPLFVREISGIYVPNKKNYIFKVIAKVKNSCRVSLRSRMSYERALTKLRVVKENGPVLSEIEGGGILILPFVFLKFDMKKEPEIVPHESEEKVTEPRKLSIRKSGGSLSHHSGNISRRETGDRQVFDNFTRYSIEALVRDDSWPLTAAEWAVAMEAKTRKFESKSSVKKSSTNGRKSERSTNISKKSLELEKTLEEPYWSLQIVTEAENELEILKDTSREDKIAELKKIWKTEELGRSERGRKLQKKFLDDNSLMTLPSAVDLTNERTRSSDEDEDMNEMVDSEVMEIWPLEKRTLEPPTNLGNSLPKLDLTIYMVKEDEEEDRWVKSDYDEETLRNQRAMNILDFEQLQASFVGKSDKLMEKRNETYRRITQRYLENRHNCKRDIDEAYKIRQALIDSTKDTAISAKSKDDNIKQKKKSEK